MSEVLVLNSSDFTGFTGENVTSDQSVIRVGYSGGGTVPQDMIEVMRATIPASSNLRTINGVVARFVATTVSELTYDFTSSVVCQISTGATDFVNVDTPSGSNVGRSITEYTHWVGNSYIERIDGSFGRFTVSFNFADPITLARNTTYYLWFYPDGVPLHTSSMYIFRDSSRYQYWSSAGAVLDGTSVTTPITASVSASPYNTNSTINGWGLYVQNYSQANISVTATGTNGAAITKCVVTLGATTVWNSAALSGRSDVIRVSGYAVPISVTVTDALGETATASTSITVHAYQSPNITNINCYRCDANGVASTNGTYLYFSCTPTYSDVNYKNSYTVSFKYGPVNGSMGSYTTISNPSTWQRIVSGLNTATSYSVVFRIVDTLGNSREFSITIPTELVTMNLKDGGTGVCFGSYADKDNCFEIANAQGWKAVISNGMYGDTLPSSGTEGQIFFRSITTPSGSANMDFAMYDSVTDLGQTSGSAEIGNTFLAMPSNSILICSAGEFASTEVPTIYGTVELVRREPYRGWVMLYGKEWDVWRKGIYADGLSRPWYKFNMTAV